MTTPPTTDTRSGKSELCTIAGAQQAQGRGMTMRMDKGPVGYKHIAYLHEQGAGFKRFEQI